MTDLNLAAGYSSKKNPLNSDAVRKIIYRFCSTPECLSSCGMTFRKLCSLVVVFLCLSGVVSNTCLTNSDDQSPWVLLTDDLCWEADSGESDKMSLSRMDGLFSSGFSDVKSNPSQCFRFVITDPLLRTLLRYSFPAGRSPPC